MRAKRVAEPGHRWHHSGGGCTCGAVCKFPKKAPVVAGMGAPEAKDVLPEDPPPGAPMHSVFAFWKKKMRAEPCHYCGGPGGTIDHIVPKSKGGKMKPRNCVPACAPCNSFRGNQPYEEFKAWGWKTRPFAVNRGDAANA